MVISYMSKVLGVITARGGSKGIPGKNIKSFLGKPLIAHTIEVAKASGVFDRLILSTDDEAIAKVASGYGCEVPFMRPAELAADNTPHLPVMQHAVSWLREHENYRPDYVMILQPTSPLRRPQHIKEAVQLISKTGSDSVVSVSPVPSHYNPHWQFILGNDERLSMYNGSPFKEIIRRRQDLATTYTKNGAIYIFKPELLYDANPSLYGDDIRAYVMDEKFSINIDTLDDWGVAEAIFKKEKL